MIKNEKIKNNDARDRLIRFYEKLKKSDIVTIAFEVPVSTVFRLIYQYKETSIVELETTKEDENQCLHLNKCKR